MEFLPNPPLHVTPNGEMATRSGCAAIILHYSFINLFNPCIYRFSFGASPRSTRSRDVLAPNHHRPRVVVDVAAPVDASQTRPVTQDAGVAHATRPTRRGMMLSSPYAHVAAQPRVDGRLAAGTTSPTSPDAYTRSQTRHNTPHPHPHITSRGDASTWPCRAGRAAASIAGLSSPTYRSLRVARVV